MNFHPHVSFKTDRIRERAQFLHQKMCEVINDMAEWAQSNGCPFVITDTVTTVLEDQTLGRVSETHRTARAFDLSPHGWDEAKAAVFCEHFEEEYAQIAAIGVKSGKRELILRHEVGNHGDHFHVQLSRSFAIKNPIPSDHVTLL
jgi:hypothetical protein